MKFISLFSGIGGFDLGLEGAGHECIAQVEKDKHALSILERHWPKVKRFHDVATFSKRRARGLVPDLICGGFPCFPAGTTVLCRVGFKDIADIEIGDEVLTHKGNWRKVLKKAGRLAETIRLRGHGHPAMVTTSNHPFWSIGHTPIWDNERRSYARNFSAPEWVDAGLMFGRYWASPTKFPKDPIPEFEVFSREKMPCKFSDAFWFIVGVWLGDGWLSTGQRPGRPQGQRWGKAIICAGRHEADELDAKLIEAGLYATRGSERTTERFTISSHALARWLEGHFGRYADGKKIPAWLLGADESVRRNVLNGYIWADGSEHGTRRKCTSICKALLVGVKLLAQSLGFSVAMHTAMPKRECVIEGRRVNERQQWQLVIDTEARSSVVVGDDRFGLVRSVQMTGKREYVYDIEVEGDHSFLADGIIVHNCQDLSVAGKRAGLAGARSGLFFEFMRIVGEFAPKWVLIENVPGLLSGCGCPLCGVVAERIAQHRIEWEAKLKREQDADLPGSCQCGECAVGRELHQAHSGRNLAIVLASLEERGYGWAYRILDSQYFNLAQRRERVFIVGHLGDGGRLDSPQSWANGGGISRLPCEVLFEPESLPWHPAPRREKRKDVAGTLESRTDAGGYPGTDGACDGHVVTHTHTATDVPGVESGSLDRGLL